jgi:PAS domain S-box-containing protein
MPLKDTPIREKLMMVILLTSGVVLSLTCAAFIAYEMLSFRETMVRNVGTLGEVIAANSTASLAFQNQDDATEILAALKAERHVVAASLYDTNGQLLAKYPASLPVEAFPVAPEQDGYRFEQSHLVGVQPVVQGNNKRLGTLYLQSDLGALYERLRLYSGIAALVLAVSFLVAYLLSRVLQQQISQPILSLAETAKAVSDRRDYSVRATKLGKDELGLLTDAFNQMLREIDEQNLALRESEERLRLVLSATHRAAWDWDIAANRLWHHEDLGAGTEGLLSDREGAGARWLERVHPADRERVVKSLKASLAGMGTVWSEEYRYRSTEGSYAHVLERGVVIRKAGKPVRMLGAMLDITERKQAESKLQAQLGRLDLLHRITRAIGERQDLQSIYQVVIRSLEDNLLIDFGCVCLYDPAAETLTVTSVGLRSGALAIELALTEQARIPVDENGLTRCVRGHLVYEPDINAVPFPFAQRLAGGGLGSFVATPLLVEGKVFGVLVVARKAPESFDSVECEFLRQLSEHVALAVHQVSLYGALQQAYEDLRQSQNTVMQQERLRALGQMASGIAHDINNAISPVALYTESLLEQESNLSARARDYLATIQRAIEDVAETVARMREFYREHEPQLLLAPVSLNRVAEQVIDLTRARWRDLPQERGIVIRMQTELASDLPVIMGAASDIRDALTNLIFNAVDAMPEGGTLTLRTRAVLAPGAAGEREPATLVRLEVCDTGMGMDEETKARCLEPFFTTKGERGTGLGLAMVYGMVQRHSAEIEIESEPGKGTTTRLVFPSAAPAAVSMIRPPAPLRPAEPLRILIVDDDPLLIKSLRDTLASDGHHVTTADGGQAGIDAFVAAEQSREPFAVVITDLGMPFVDGRQVAAAVKSASPSTPVILLTGWGQRLIAEDEIPAHVDRVLNKPPRLLHLRTALAGVTADSPPA